MTLSVRRRISLYKSRRSDEDEDRAARAVHSVERTSASSCTAERKDDMERLCSKDGTHNFF